MVTADPDVSVPAALIGDPTRAVFLAALTEARALPASELAARAGVSAQTASGHLTNLVRGGLLPFQRRGRRRYSRLADPAIAAALEALAAIAPRREPRSLRESDAAVALRAARTCYDHLAGRLGMALT